MEGRNAKVFTHRSFMTSLLPWHTDKWHKCNSWNWWPNDLGSWRSRVSVMDFWSNHSKPIMYATDTMSQKYMPFSASFFEMQTRIWLLGEAEPLQFNEEQILSWFLLIKLWQQSMLLVFNIIWNCIACFQYYMELYCLFSMLCGSLVVFNSVSNFRAWVSDVVPPSLISSKYSLLH